MADVESSNVVGYTGKTVEAGKYYLIGTQFDKAGEATGAIDMNDLVSLSSEIVPGTYDDDFATAPMIQVLNASGSGYNLYYYISDATDSDDTPLGYNCWADTDGYELSEADRLSLGKGFWFKSQVSGTVTISGEVLGSASKVVNFPGAQFYIMANPYPKAVSLANVATSGVTPGLYDDDFATAPMIQVLNSSATGYNLYYYISDATDSNDDPIGYNCWADTDGYVLEGTQVDAGASFWIKSATAGSIGFSL